MEYQCKVHGCPGVYHARGYCRRHYNKNWDNNRRHRKEKATINIENALMMLTGVTSGLEGGEESIELSPEQAKGWLTELNSSVKVLNDYRKVLRRIYEDQEDDYVSGIGSVREG